MASPEVTASTDKTIGHIRLTETLGEGGMGAVFAGFDETLEREVAVKAIRGGYFHAEGKERFLREARILSQLDHPRICRIYDYLEDEDGYYLILERIHGRPLRQAMDEGIEPARKMEIALQVAEALVAAHARGIIHRDLKPENVMLTQEGGLKILDFGVSRIFDPERGGATRDSGEGTRFGTVSYMSPEQARGEPESPAGDMYTFGLLLHELFTGRSAYPALAAPFVAAYAAAGNTLPVTGVAADLAELVSELESARPEDRPSASEALARLQRIADQPRRRIRRISAAAAALLLLAFAVKYTLDLSRERRLAIEARQQAEEVVDFLVGLLQLSSPGSPIGEGATAREILDRGAREITSGELDTDPLTRARLLHTIGGIYRELGLYSEAAPLLEEALALRRRELGDRHPDVASSADRLAGLRRTLGDHEEAEDLFQEALEIYREDPGTEDLDLAHVVNNLATLYRDTGRLEEAEILFGQALEIYEENLESGDPRLAVVLDNLASLHRARGAYGEAEPLYERALEIREATLGPEHPDVATTVSNLAALRRIRGDYGRAEPLFRRALEIRRRTLGEEHSRVAILLNNLAFLHQNQGDLEKAEPLYLQAIEIYEKSLGSDHHFVATSLHHLGRLYLARKDSARAAPLFERALEIRREAYTSDHPLVIQSFRSLAESAVARGRPREAETFFRKALEAGDRLLARDPANLLGQSELAAALLGWGELLRDRGDPAAAERCWQRAASLVEPLVESSDAVAYLDVYARALLLLGREDEARPIVRDLWNRGWRGPELAESAGLGNPDGKTRPRSAVSSPG